MTSENRARLKLAIQYGRQAQFLAAIGDSAEASNYLSTVLCLLMQIETSGEPEVIGTFHASAP